MERFYETEGYESGSNVLRMVGYFALVGLLRVHTLVGDYGGALAALAPIHPFQRAHLFTPKIAGAPGAPKLEMGSRRLQARAHMREAKLAGVGGAKGWHMTRTITLWVFFKSRGAGCRDDEGGLGFRWAAAACAHGVCLWVAGCNIALYYYSGFCYLQQRRYMDAARAFNSVLTYIAR